MIDHYRTLGVARTADETDIRAAYLAAMRRYHPDQNPAPEAAEHAKLVSLAYSILSRPRRRAAYDQQLVTRTMTLANPSPRQPVRGRGAFLALVGLAAALTGFAATRLPPNSGLLPPVSEAQLAREARAEERALGPCPERLSNGAVRSALFGRLGEGRPSNPEAFRLAAAHATVRLTSVVQQGSHLLGDLRCQATLLLELPSGVTTIQGSRSMLTDVTFAPVGGGRGVLRLETDELLQQELLGVTLADPMTFEPAPIDPGEPLAAPAAAEESLPGNDEAASSNARAPDASASSQAPVATHGLPTRAAKDDLVGLNRHQKLLSKQGLREDDARQPLAAARR